MAISTIPETVRIMNDTVLKLSIMQGLEAQRTNDKLGQFTSGELAYTRDTGRVFVGDFSDGMSFNTEEQPDIQKNLQSTMGGSITGNKYIGLIDSRPLASFADNVTALSYDNVTSMTGTQENPSMVEQGLLTNESKFRNTYMNEFGESVTNWDRTATYNRNLNAYTGDYFFDVYQNALILVDHRISTKDKREESDFEDAWIPEFAVDEATGNLKSPQTFIDENGTGEEVSSTSIKALGQKRRTPLRNYIHNGDNGTKSSNIYGEGYVVMRILEPDNYTIRFKPRAFDLNGLPDDEDGGDNYNHNLLEVFYVPLCAISMHFSDDFTIPDCKNDLIYLNKEIQNVKSITGNGGALKLPGSIIFANPIEGGRGSIGYTQWNFLPPPDVTFPSSSTYNVKLVPSKMITDSKDSNVTYPAFDVMLEKQTLRDVTTYYVNLKGGLRSDQTNPFRVRIDEDAINPLTAPTITFSTDGLYKSTLVDNETDPFNVGKGGYTVYSGNFSFTTQGTVKTIDTYEDNYYIAAASRIKLYEEQNTSINLLKKPVTIMSTSSSPTLYTALNGNLYNSSGTLAISTKTPAAADKVTTAINNVKDIVDKITAINQIKVGANTAPASLTNYANSKVTSGQVLAVDNTQGAASGGVCVALSTAAITQTNIEVGKIYVSATISGLTNTSYTNRFTGFIALKNGSNILKLETFEQYYSNFSFTFEIDANEILLSGSTYVVIGIRCDNLNTKFNIKFDQVKYTYRSLDNEQKFEAGRGGINAYLDFCSEPYLYCFRKIVTTPDINMLPVATTTNWPGKINSGYFTNFNSNKSYLKTWNNMAWVLGHNHYLNNDINDSTVPIINRNNMNYTGADIINKKIFKYIRGFEVDSETLNPIKHDIIDQNDSSAIIFSWWAEYQKNGTDRINVIYYVDERFEIRDDKDVADQGDDIDYVYIANSLTNLITTAETNDAIIKGGEVDYGDSWYAKQYVIMSDSELLNNNASYIRYGRKSNLRQWVYNNGDGEHVLKVVEQNPWEASNDLLKSAGLVYDYELKGFSQYTEGNSEGDTVAKIVLHNGTTEGALEIVDGDEQLRKILNEGITIDSIIGTAKVSDFNYMTIFYTDVTSNDPEDYTITYQIIDGIYAAGAYLPRKNLGTGAIINAAGNITNVTINEEIPSDYQVYIPNHARTILLEMTHITSTNNTVGVSYSNEFSNLGVLLSGKPSLEYNGNGPTISTDIQLNPWQEYPNEVDGGYNDDGTMQMPDTKVKYESKAFHDTTIMPGDNQRPSAYSTNINEKMLCLSSQSETKIIEVPFQKSNESGIRHFALRLTNLRPATTESANHFSLKVIGYRV